MSLVREWSIAEAMRNFPCGSYRIVEQAKNTAAQRNRDLPQAHLFRHCPNYSTIEVSQLAPTKVNEQFTWLSRSPEPSELTLSIELKKYMRLKNGRSQTSSFRTTYNVKLKSIP